MSSGVLLNGATAENFSLGTVEGHHQDPSGVAYDAWEPEDLVATVQFLATLDDRLPYVLPTSNNPPPTSDDTTERLLPSPFCHDGQQHQKCDDDDMNPTDSKMDATSTSSPVEEVSEPQLSSTLLGEVCSPPVALSDITTEENSVSSAAQTPCSTEERSIIRASNKPAHLKRVSFGSTKGSMVETLIYESPQNEEEPSASTSSGWTKTAKSKTLRSVIGAVPDPLPEETVALLSESSRSASKVRVTYFESKRPLTLPSPEASDAEWDDMAEPPPQQYTRQASTESGQDNPFRPDGDLSREADELVELLKGGRPISEVLKGKEDVVHHQQQSDHQQSEQASQLAGSPPRTAPSSPVKAESPDAGRINGSLTEQEKKAAEAEGGAVEIQRGVVAPVTGESQAEHVVIKKKSKCQCCVIQ